MIKMMDRKKDQNRQFKKKERLRPKKRRKLRFNKTNLKRRSQRLLRLK
jgi:hypothetical protein